MVLLCRPSLLLGRIWEAHSVLTQLPSKFNSVMSPCQTCTIAVASGSSTQHVGHVNSGTPSGQFQWSMLQDLSLSKYEDSGLVWLNDFHSEQSSKLCIPAQRAMHNASSSGSVLCHQPGPDPRVFATSSRNSSTTWDFIRHSNASHNEYHPPLWLSPDMLPLQLQSRLYRYVSWKTIPFTPWILLLS